MNALLIAAALLCGQFDQDLAIAIAVNAPQANEQDVVSVPKVQSPAKTVEQQYRLETRYRDVEQKYCWQDWRGRRHCGTKTVREAYTVKVPIAPGATHKGYPVRKGWWSGCKSWQHLTRGDHANTFDPAWLQSLTWAELQSLHSDHHETLKYGRNKVHWDYVVRP